jgi:hypothetical protein
VSEVRFRKQCSDGNYGTEAAEVVLVVSDDADVDELVAAALATARRLVHDELRQSPSGNVRRALEYPPHEREQRWRQAEASAELELAIGKRQAYADPEDLSFGDDE